MNISGKTEFLVIFTNLKKNKLKYDSSESLLAAGNAMKIKRGGGV